MRRRQRAQSHSADSVQPTASTNSPLRPKHPRGGASSPAVATDPKLSSSSEDDRGLDDRGPFPMSSDGESEASSTPMAGAQEAFPVVQAPPKSRWQDWWLRLSMTFVMIGGCFAYVYIGRQAGVVLLIFVLQTGIYKELVRIASIDSKERALPGFAYFYWYWFFVSTFFIYTWTLKPYLLSGLAGVQLVRPQFAAPHAAKAYTVPFIDPSADLADAVLAAGNVVRSAAVFIVREYVPIAFALYCAGLIAFVFSLRRRRNFKYQFSQFAYCHVAILAVVFQSTFLAALVFNGLIWFFLPCGLVVCNDSFAYVAGFFFGRTPLIRLSPKKTVEGFVGGALATVVFAVLATGFWQSSELFNTKWLMLCPVQSGGGNWGESQYCDTTAVAGGIFVPQPLSSFLVGRMLPAAMLHWRLSAMQLHAAVIALFASIVAPFGGFFASGFKRAAKLKDFGNVIPGHGGFTDRMDCQLLMGTFAYIYAHYFLGGYQAGPAAVAFHVSTIVNSRLPIADLQSIVAQLSQHVAELQKQEALLLGTGG